MALDPHAQYRINKQPAYLTRGVFRNVENGKVLFVREAEIDITKTETLMQGCPTCGTEQYWIDLATLDDAQGCIECEYCTFIAVPVVSFSGFLAGSKIAP